MIKIATMLIFLGGCGTQHKIKVQGGTTNTAEVHVTIDQPLADKCFTDPRVVTYEQLKECVEITTDNTLTIDVNGNIVEILDVLKEAG